MLKLKYKLSGSKKKKEKKEKKGKKRGEGRRKGERKKGDRKGSGDNSSLSTLPGFTKFRSSLAGGTRVARGTAMGNLSSVY